MKSKIEIAFLPYLFFILLNMSSCTSPQQQESTTAKNSAQQLLEKTVAAHGGLERFSKLKTLHYKKDFTLYDAEGQTEKTFKQVHSYDYVQKQFSISSIQGADTIVSSLNAGQYSRTKNGQAAEASSSSIEKSMNSAFYVLGVPFNLHDAGVELSQEENILVDGKEYLLLSAHYNSDAHANHSSSEPWQFYIDKKDNLIRKNWVQSSDHINVVENLSFEEVGGLLLHQKRRSYRVDSLRTKLFLRAEYHYYDYKASF